MTHLDDDSDGDSFLYDETPYNPGSEAATNAGTGLTGSAAATARLEATLVARRVNPVNPVVNLAQGTALPPAVPAVITPARQAAPTTTTTTTTTVRGAAWTDFECLKHAFEVIVAHLGLQAPVICRNTHDPTF
jgi:hypothetical protein